MSNEDKEPVEENEINEEADGLLQLLVASANAGSAAPLTLFVGGATISGVLIGHKEYLDVFTTHMATGWDEDEVRELKESFGLFDEPEVEKEDSAQSLRYIHLRDAKVFAPGQQPLPANGLLWRGKLAAVDGFSYGIFGPAPDED